MPAGARTFRLEETLLDPPALAPPPVRHALLVFLLTLATILHGGTAGWDDIGNGAEGIYAGGARQMLVRNSWFPPLRDEGALPNQPPLLYWLVAASCKTFGVTAAAARFPIVLATIASVALTFLIGERLAGYWRGFVAGLIHLCSLGAFIWGRLVTPEPLLAALVGAAVFSLICGYQRRRRRRWWFAATWLWITLAYLTKGLAVLALFGLMIALFAALFREARLRFRELAHWTVALPFVAALVGWHAVTGTSPVFAQPALAGAEPTDSFLFVGMLIGVFPTLPLVAPAVVFAARRILRPREFDFADALPLCWLVAGVAVITLSGTRLVHDSIGVWSPFALFAAVAWERSSMRFRIAGIVLAAFALILAAGFAPTIPTVFATPELVAHCVAAIGATAVTFAIFAAAAGYLTLRGRGTLAIIVVMLAIVPIGLTAAETMARFSPYFSLARAAQFLNSRPVEHAEVLYEGSSGDVSSLGFYLTAPFHVVESAERALEKMAAPHSVYLIVDAARVPFWQEQLTARFHIYHQVTTCGRHVVIHNQP